jgi:signal transduction histidine kinase/DNA-binding response OmpR family regulator/ligand-binding sensor domain-containing protein
VRIFIIAIFLVGFVFNAKTQNFVFDKITTREGLSQNDVNTIYQDKNGFLWIGTNDGLNRYDGYNFKTFRINPKGGSGIKSNLIFDITEDPSGNLWMATSDEGVCKFDVKTEEFTIFENTAESPHLLQTNQITKVFASKNGTVWVGSALGMDIIEQKNGQYLVKKFHLIASQNENGGSVTAIQEDDYGRIWIGTRDGVQVFSETEGLINLISINSSTYVKDIVIRDEEVYVAFMSGVWCYKLDWETLTKFRSTKISDVNVNCMQISNDGDLFLGNHNGLYIVERDNSDWNKFLKEKHFTEGWETNSLNKNVVKSLYEDKSGIIWIGTNGGGLNKYNPRQKKFRNYSKTRIAGSLSYNKIRAIYQDSEENIWIGTEAGGVNFLSKSKNKNYESGWEYINVNPTGQNFSYSFVELDSEEKDVVELITGTGYPAVVSKVTYRNNKLSATSNTGVYDEITNSPFTFLKDRNGTVWAGTYGRSNGLVRITKTDNVEKLTDFISDGKPGSISSHNIRSLQQDYLGNIWIGTDNGLSFLPAAERLKENPKFVVFKREEGNPHSISHNYILPIFQSKDSTVWIGTMGGGLNKVIYNDNPELIRFEAITTADGLPNNVIKGILEDDFSTLWISSNKGLSQYFVKDGTFVNYGISDGLQDYEFGELACCKLNDGEMLFGGVNGFNAFYPKDIIQDKSLPALALTDFHILNQPVVPGEERNGRVVLENVINHTEKIRLKYAENSFAIYFSSLHFSAPAKNEYKYILEGFDNDWIRKDANDRIAKYTNLRPGKYTFKVLSSNNDGIWTNAPKVLEITITPPWYLSTIAWLIYIILFLTSLWFFQKFSLIKIKQKNELLMEYFEKEKIQELSQMKLRFFTNISHEFRTPLTLIIGPLENLIRQGGELTEKKIAESHAIMHRNASILLRLINQLVDFRKFEQGKMILRASNSNVVSFLYEVFLSFSELAKNKNICYDYSSSREEIGLWFDDDKLERIMYNLLSNAFKFTQEGGRINLVVDEDDTHVIIRVEDDGVGIPAEMQKHIFERFYQADRIKNRKVGSTGIGLSFIKGLVEMHSGEITFESIEDQGTTFVVRLKKGDAHLEKEQKRAVTREINTTAKNYSYLEPVKVVADDELSEGSTKPKVLLVEDNFELRSFIKDSLRDRYEISVAENGKEGLEKLQEFEPEVIVSDIMMPLMNGFELCDAIKTDEKISHIPIILLTAKSSAENRIKGYNLGADGYISKPFNLEVLSSRIQNLIESREKLRNKLRTTITVEPSEVTTTSMDEKFLKRILKIIEENIPNSEFTVEKLANDYGMSQIVMNKKLKGLTGVTAKAFIRSIRLKRAAQLFATGKYSVTDVTYEVGFSDLKYFRTCFKDEFGLSPSEYMKQKKEENTEQ